MGLEDAKRRGLFAGFDDILFYFRPPVFTGNSALSRAGFAAGCRNCRRQLEEIDELQLSLSHELDRRDLLREVSAGFATLRNLDDGTLARMGASRHELAALEGLLARWWRLGVA